ncbi:MAG: AI-2E family transporter [Archangiaceae bacterium]|nr:AI-2E family transporter [Archangiaceae bacterium]
MRPVARSQGPTLAEAPRPAEAPRAVRHQRVLLTCAAGLVCIIGLQHLGGFLAPVLFGAMVAGASAPLVSWLNRRRVPIVVSAAAVLLIDFLALASLGWLFLSAAGDLQERLPGYISRILGLSNELTHHLGSAAALPLHDKLDADRLNAAVSSIAERLIGITSFGAVVAFVVFFTLCEGEDLGQKLRTLKPAIGPRLEKLEKVMVDVRSYLLVKSFTSLLAAAATWLIADAFDLPLATLLALSMFLLHFIPNIGAVAVTLAAVGVALVERGTGAALAVGSGMALVCLVVGSVLEPQFLGRALRLSPLMVLLGMLFWGWLWGPVGALLSVPLMVVAKAALENSELQWLGQLMGNRAAEPHPSPARRPVLVLRRRIATPVSGQNAS